MNLVRWNNQPRFSGMFNNFFDNELDFTHRKESGCTPRTNIIENDNAFMLEFAVPGMSKKDFKINLENNLLSISAEIEDEKKEEVNYTRKEFDSGSFTRSFVIPKLVEADTIKADYKNGVLSVTLPKKDADKVKVSKEIRVA